MDEYYPIGTFLRVLTHEAEGYKDKVGKVDNRFSSSGSHFYKLKLGNGKIIPDKYWFTNDHVTPIDTKGNYLTGFDESQLPPQPYKAGKRPRKTSQAKKRIHQRKRRNKTKRLVNTE